MRHHPNKAGFTLIEMLIVIMIVGVTIPLLMTIFVSVLRQQVRVKGLEIAKSQADAAFSDMKTAIRNNAVSIHSAYPATSANEICTTQTSAPVSANPLVFLNKNGDSFYYSLASGTLTYRISTAASAQSITSAPAVMSNLSATCERGSDGSDPIVTLSFDSSHPQIGVVLNYRTKVTLRNR